MDGFGWFVPLSVGKNGFALDNDGNVCMYVCMYVHTRYVCMYVDGRKTGLCLRVCVYKKSLGLFFRCETTSSPSIAMILVSNVVDHHTIPMSTDLLPAKRFRVLCERTASPETERGRLFFR